MKASDVQWHPDDEQYDPKPIWWDPPWKLYQWPPARPLYRGTDEFWRRTYVLHLPLLGRVVVAGSVIPESERDLDE